MSGKGSKPRPCSVTQDQFADNWARTFNRGVAEQSKADGSNPSTQQCDTVGANPTAAAIYIDNCTGRQVTEEWWPGDPLPESQ